MEVRRSAHQYQFPGDKTPVIRGSAKKAKANDPKVRPLCRNCWMQWMNSSLCPLAKWTNPFLMCIEDVFNIEVVALS